MTTSGAELSDLKRMLIQEFKAASSHAHTTFQQEGTAPVASMSDGDIEAAKKNVCGKKKKELDRSYSYANQVYNDKGKEHNKNSIQKSLRCNIAKYSMRTLDLILGHF